MVTDELLTTEEASVTSDPELLLLLFLELSFFDDLLESDLLP